MLLDLRDGIRNSKWLKYVLVTIICIPFALVGINSYFSGGGPDYAVKVNGEKVSLNAFNSAYQQQRAQITQAFGGRIPEGFDVTGMVNTQAMDSLITREVIRQATVENDFAIGDDALAKQILDFDQFNVDGRFDKERYEMQLRSMGVSAAEFESQYRNDLIMQQFSGAVVGSGFALGSENKRLESLRDQKRNLKTITFDVAATAETVEVSDDDVAAYYDENTARFNNPQKVTVEYLELKIDDLTDAVEVTDADLKGFYDQNKTRWVVPEKRDASHILLSVEDDSDDEEKLTLAKSLIERITAGESFEALAKEFSDDPGSGGNGGSLGEFGRGVMVAPFENTVFAMQADEISEPVKSDFGYHIIRLNKVIAEQGQAFDEVRDQIEEQFRQEQAENDFFSASELLSNAAYENSDSLQPAADETGLEIKTSDWIDSNSTDGIGQFRQVIAAALSDDVLNQGINSEVLEVGDNHAIVLRTLDHQEAAPKPLDEVREDIIGTLQQERATTQLTELADSLHDQLPGADAEAIATQNNGVFADAGAIGRNGPDTDSQVRKRLFEIAKPAGENEAVYDTVSTADGNIALIIFGGLGLATDEESDGAQEEVSGGTASTGATEFQALLSTLEESVEVERNEALLSDSAAY